MLYVCCVWSVYECVCVMYVCICVCACACVCVCVSRSASVLYVCVAHVKRKHGCTHGQLLRIHGSMT